MHVFTQVNNYLDDQRMGEWTIVTSVKDEGIGMSEEVI